MVVGILVTHGNLAEELLQTARLVYGDFSGCYAISNTAKSTEDLTAELDSLVASVKGTPCIIFVDFIGGSCSHACLKHAHAHTSADVRMLSGVNLPMLLAFLNKRDEVAFAQLPEAILERGHKSIQVVDPTTI
jgi:mannose PTS system EIIA component